MKKPSISPLFVLVALAAMIPAQRTWIVSPSGGDFTQIDPAIQAASNGDRIEVRAGTYDGFTLNKRLAIVGADRTTTILGSDSSILKGSDGAEIANFETRSVLVKQVAGPVLLREIYTKLVNPQPKLTIEDSGPVHVKRCVITGALFYGKPDLVTLTRSTVYMHRCWVWGWGFDPTTGAGYRAMIATDSDLVMADTKIMGAEGRSGGSSCFSPPTKGPGGDAIHLVRSSMAVIAASELAGGPGGSAFGGKCAPDGAAAVGGIVDFSADSKVIGTATTRPLGVLPKLDLVGSLALGTTGTATITFASGKTIASYFSLGHAHIRLPGVDLPVFLGGTIHFFDARAVTSGTASVSIPIPNVPAFRNLILYFQCLGYDTGGRGALSNSTALWLR